MSIRKNDKQRPLGIVRAIPEFIGVMAGISMLAGKWIKLHVRDFLGEKPKQPKQVAKRPVQLEADMRIDAIEKKMASQKQAKATVPKPIQPEQEAKKPVQLEAEMRIAAIKKKIASQKQAKVKAAKKPAPPTLVKTVKTKKKTAKKTSKGVNRK